MFNTLTGLKSPSAYFWDLPNLRRVSDRLISLANPASNTGEYARCEFSHTGDFHPISSRLPPQGRIFDMPVTNPVCGGVHMSFYWTHDGLAA